MMPSNPTIQPVRAQGPPTPRTFDPFRWPLCPLRSVPLTARTLVSVSLNARAVDYCRTPWAPRGPNRALAFRRVDAANGHLSIPSLRAAFAITAPEHVDCVPPG